VGSALCLSEAQVCKQTVFDDFCKYMTEDYVIESGQYAGQSLSVASVLNYVGCLVQMAAPSSSTRDAAHKANSRMRGMEKEEEQPEEEDYLFSDAKEAERRMHADEEKQTAWGCLLPGADDRAPKVPPNASICYLTYMEKNRNMPGISNSDRNRLNRLVEIFDAMATTEEKKQLKPPPLGGSIVDMVDMGERRVIASNLSTLVKYYLQSKFMTFSGGIRPTLMPGKEFLTSHIENNERLLKKESLEISDLSALRTWRLANENQVLGEEVQALMAANRPGGKKRKA